MQPSATPNRDNVAFEAVFQTVRSAFIAHYGPGATEEFGRQGLPTLTFTWEEGDVNFNFSGTVFGDTEPSGVQIEGNAWVDLREGNENVRYFLHIPGGRGVKPTEQNVNPLVSRVYEALSKIDLAKVKTGRRSLLR